VLVEGRGNVFLSLVGVAITALCFKVILFSLNPNGVENMAFELGISDQSPLLATILYFPFHIYTYG